MKRINLLFITIASMFVFSIQAMKLNQPDQFSDLNTLAECYFTRLTSLAKQKYLRIGKPVFKRSRRRTLQRFTIKPKNKRIRKYPPVNTEFCREDCLSYFQVLMRANAKKNQNIANQKRWEKLRCVAPKMMSVMREIGNDDIARYIRSELIEAQYEEMSKFD